MVFVSGCQPSHQAGRCRPPRKQPASGEGGRVSGLEISTPSKHLHLLKPPPSEPGRNLKFQQPLSVAISQDTKNERRTHQNVKITKRFHGCLPWLRTGGHSLRIRAGCLGMRLGLYTEDAEPLDFSTQEGYVNSVIVFIQNQER